MTKISKFNCKKIIKRKIVMIHSTNAKNNKLKWFKIFIENNLSFEFVQASNLIEKLSMIYNNQNKIRRWNNDEYGSNCYYNYNKILFFNDANINQLIKYVKFLNLIGLYSRLANTSSIICNMPFKQINPEFFYNIDYFMTDNIEDLINMIKKIKNYYKNITTSILEQIIKISQKILESKKNVVIDLRKMSMTKIDVFQIIKYI